MAQKASFENWRAIVEAIVVRKTDMGTEFLPDVDYIGLYKTGNTPLEAANYVIQYAKEN